MQHLALNDPLEAQVWVTTASSRKSFVLHGLGRGPSGISQPLSLSSSGPNVGSSPQGRFCGMFPLSS